MTSAIVVGSGPNGLACAAALAREGLEVTVLEAEPTIGGGTRSAELTVPGVVHDVCSAFHPLSAENPFLRSLGVYDHGLEWRWPEVDCAHPLDDGSAGVLKRSLDETARGLGADERAWRRMFAPARTFAELSEDLMRPIAHVPHHPLRLMRFGASTLLPATVLTRVWKTEQARALFGGVAGHSFAPLNRPFSSAIGLALTTACHAFGWPVARGGTQAIADSLASVLRAHGGAIETNVRVRSLADLPQADAVVFDLAPRAIADIMGDRLPARVARAYRRYKHGPGAFKVDFAVQAGVPWTNEACRRAGTVHLAGTFDELARLEREVNDGRMPERPFVLVGQQYLADPERSAGDVHPVWAYAHVPRGYTADATEAVIGQIERFAPGFRERIVAKASASPAEIHARNANYVGGDIITGANTPVQTLIRPRFGLNPYSTGADGFFICSAATPPGPGAHGMCGAGAAKSVLLQYG